MKQILLLFLVFCSAYCKKESIDELADMLNDPEIFFELKKRLGNLLDDAQDVDQSNEAVVGCNALSGTLNGTCNFSRNSSTIIKTTESMGNGATFITSYSNVTCARDCTVKCCSNKDCDTAVFQAKGEHSCYLFKCGHPSKCVFVHHEDYGMSSISKEVHQSHQYTPGGANHSHENELANLATHKPNIGSSVTTVEPMIKIKPTHTTKPKLVPGKTVPPKPVLGDTCENYEAECEGAHVECLMRTCRCRVGYHEKHGVCRKHCGDNQFECENIGYSSSVLQCVPNTEVCDGNQDCEDGSDEYGCPDIKDDKTAYQDPDASLYNNPLYNLPFANQQDNRYPYGFPIPGLANQQQAAILPSNQLYPSQIQPNGQYYYSNVANQNPIAPASNQLSPQQWPFLDKNVGYGSQLYPNTNSGYQIGQQSGYVPPQIGNYIPVAQSPVQAPVQVNPNVQPVQLVPNQNVNPIAQQQNPVVVKPTTKAPDLLVQKDNKVPQITQERGQDHNEMNKAVPVDKPSTKKPITLDRISNNKVPGFVKSDESDESRNDYFDDTTVGHQKPSLSMFGNNVMNLNSGQADKVNDGKAKQNTGRHSAEIDDIYEKPKTFPPATKPKTQIGTPTQSTAAGERHSQTHSEGFPDYSWVKYDSDSPRVSGKKGTSRLNNRPSKPVNTDTKQRMKPSKTGDNSNIKKPSLNDRINKQNNRLLPSSKFDDRAGGYDYEADRYPGHYGDEYQRPTNNHRTSYDRYRDRFSDNRRRPGHGSRYPYYDTGYNRGRDRNPYPVWNKYTDEYYYPETYEDNDAAVKQNIDYENIPDTRPSDSGTSSGDQHKAAKPIIKVPGNVPVTKVPAVGISTQVSEKDVTLTTKAPVITEPPKEINTDKTDIQKESEESSESVEKEDNPASPDKDNKENEETDEKSNEKAYRDNNTESDTSNSNADKPFRILNADTIEVDTYTDSSQGPIVALALGLAITMMLLIFVGCRLRTVKRRLRKGRALHSNEADYLINGMYL